MPQTLFSQRWIDALTRASSSSVPAPAEVREGGTAGDQGFGVGGDEVVRQLDELGMCAPDVAELCGAELGEIGLGLSALEVEWMASTYVNIESDDRVLSTCPF